MSRGQASLEYVGVLALVAVVLGAAAALTGAPDLAGAVGGQIRRALCIVARGDCLSRAGPIPCVTSVVEDATETTADVLVLRLADGRVVLREQRSDGSVAVTVAQSSGAGAGFVFGARLRVGRWSARSGAEVEAGARAVYSRRFVRPDGPSADRLVAELADRDPAFGGVARELGRLVVRGEDDGPVPAEREYALGGEVRGDLALRTFGLGAHADALRAATIGLRLDERTGERAAVVRLRADTRAALVAPRTRLAFAVPSDATGAVTFDGAGRPVRFVVTGAQAVRGEVRAPGFSREGGDRVEAELRLELDDPAAQADLLGALAGLPGPAARTARRIADDARIDVRVYETARQESVSGLGVRVGGGLGYERVEALERRRLVRAFAREPGQGWGPNLDCRPAA